MDEMHDYALKRIVRHFWAPVRMLEAMIVLQIVLGKHIEALIIAALLLFNVGLAAFAVALDPRSS